MALLLGVTAVLIAGVSPLILGGLAQEGRLTASQIGLTAMAEGLSMAVSTALAATLLKPRSLRRIGSSAALVHVLATLATIWSTGATIILCRTIAGLAAGILLWITIGMIARSTKPERWSGLFLTLQTLTQFGFAAALPLTVIPRFGVNGMLFCLATLSALTMIAAFAGPRSYPDLPKRENASLGFGPRALAGLFTVFAQLAFVTAVWVYFERLATQSGFPPKIAGLMIALTLAAQVMGGIAATWIGGRLAAITVFAVAALINLAVLAALATEPGMALFMACAILFGFLWLFVMPFQVQFLIEIDPSRHAAMQIATAQILGSSAGPLAAAFLVSDTDIRGALGFGAACVLISVATAALIHLGGRRQARSFHAPD